MIAEYPGISTALNRLKTSLIARVPGRAHLNYPVPVVDLGAAGLVLPGEEGLMTGSRLAAERVVGSVLAVGASSARG